MFRALLFVILTVQLISCTNGSQQKRSNNGTGTSSAIAPIFADHSQSTLEVFKDSSSTWNYKSTEITYKMLTLSGNPFGAPFQDVKIGNDLEYYIAKFTTTTIASHETESPIKNIAVEIRPLRNPEHSPVLFKQDCDDISFDFNCYKTTKYGCCGGEEQLAFYDLENNLIIAGDARILTGDIPNSKIKFYTAFKLNDRDTSMLGTLFISYGSQDKYRVRIRPTPDLPVSCEYMTPEIFFYSSNASDKMEDNDKFALWSLDNIKSKEQVTNIGLKVVFGCNSGQDKVDTITIPIINGKPFGKSEMVQDYSYRRN